MAKSEKKEVEVKKKDVFYMVDSSNVRYPVTEKVYNEIVELISINRRTGFYKFLVQDGSEFEFLFPIAEIKYLMKGKVADQEGLM